jgi:superfamily I DNA/RNA helicase
MPLPTPVGTQRDVLALPPEGHTVVLGSVGSGKTTLAILRAANLADAATEHGGSTLLVTFNRALITYLRSLSGGVLHGATVENYHRFARGYLRSRGKLPPACIVDPDPRSQLIRAAIAQAKESYASEPLLQRPSQFFDDEIRYIQRQGVDSVENYVGITRIGRTARLARSDRDLMWAVYELYLEARADAGKLYDWDDIAATVITELEIDIEPRRYRHVVIDEGQDFSPQMLRSLVRAIPDDGSITFFGDLAQQIYGRGISWRSAGLKPPKVWEFQDNHRNSRQIATLAQAIAAMPYFDGVEDLVLPRLPAADGPLPTIVPFADREAETRFVLDQVGVAGKTQRVAVLLRDRNDERHFAPHLRSTATRLHRELLLWPMGPGVFYGTYHGAKGLEFDTVYMPFCDASRLPDPVWATEHPDDDADNQFGSLIYVAVTRARRGLVISHSSELSRLFPAEPAFYRVVSP